MRIFITLLAFLFCSFFGYAQEQSQTEIFFEKNSSELSSSSFHNLDALAQKIKGADSVLTKIEGFSDNSGSHSHNLKLSQERANVVASYLNSQLTDRVSQSVKAYGEMNPKYNNNLPTEQGMNRRVVITALFFQTESQTVSEAPQTKSTDVPNAEPTEVVAIEELWIPPTRQVFKVDPSNAIMIQGEKGTVVDIPAKAFKIPNGLKGEPVYVEMTEYYDRSEMIRAGLTTQLEDGSLLESGGMVDIRAFAGDTEIDLKGNKKMDLTFPTESYEEGMKEWYGVEDKDGNMLWSKTPRDLKGRNKNGKKILKGVLIGAAVVAVAAVTIAIVSDGGSSSSSKTSTSSERIGKSSDKIESLENSGFKSTSKGNTTSTSSKGTVKRPSSIPSSNRPETCSNPSNSSTTSNRRDIPGTTRPTSSKAPKIPSAKNAPQRTDRYRISSRSTGWVNCDRLLSVTRSQSINFVVKNEFPDADVKLVFNNRNVIVQGRQVRDKVVFDNVPIGQACTVVGLKKTAKGELLAMETTNTSAIRRPQLNYTPSTESSSQAQLKSID